MIYSFRHTWPGRTSSRRVAAKFVSLPVIAALLAGCVHDKTVVRGGAVAPVVTARPAIVPAALDAEQIRSDCIKGRRLICGKVLKVYRDGLVVESGYTDLLRPPLTESWVAPGTAVASRNPAVLERNDPGTPCIGLAFLTDIPKRPKVKQYDYVILMGYPAGEFTYAPVPGVNKTIRKFSAGLDTAVRLIAQTRASDSPANSAPAR